MEQARVPATPGVAVDLKNKTARETILVSRAVATAGPIAFSEEVRQQP